MRVPEWNNETEQFLHLPFHQLEQLNDPPTSSSISDPIKTSILAIIQLKCLRYVVYKFDPTLPAWIHQQSITDDQAADILYQHIHILTSRDILALRQIAKRFMLGKRPRGFVQIRYTPPDEIPTFYVTQFHAPPPGMFDPSDDESFSDFDDLDEQDVDMRSASEDEGYQETSV